MAYEARDDLLSAKLTEEEVEELLLRRRKGDTLKALAEDFKVHPNTVRNIIQRSKNRKR